MKSHASINRIYRLVWNSALQLWVAVAENARGCGKGGSLRSSVAFGSADDKTRHADTGFRLHARCRAAMAMLLVLSTANLQVHAADALNATVVAGSGNVATTGNVTTINQGTQNLAIDWTSLSTRANEALVFNQPNASAIALNRIIGSSPSELLGSLTANGQVFILNPNGVLFGAGSQVNVGGLLASTLSLSNADFLSGKYTFSGAGAGSVVNQGTLSAAPGGYLALLAPEVRNEGVMTASLGTALLAAGNKVTLNLDNGSLLGYSIDQGAINALAENKQLIQANGGQVLLSAKAMDSLTTAAVNNTGIIEAKTVQNKAGRILLMGDMEVGTVNVGGTLDASAPTGGNGGFIETSAAHVNVVNDAHITTRAASGRTGEWLIDPFDFVVAAAGGNITGAALGAQLDNNNVTLNTTAGNSGTNGDLSVNDGVSWSGANTLTLVGERDVNVNANIAYSGSGTSGVTVQAVRDINIATGVGIRATGTGALPVVLGGAAPGTAAGGNINMGSGSAVASNGGDVTFRANAISLSGASVAAGGGNITMTASGANAGHALEIANAGVTQSNVTTSGAGTITLNGNLTSGGASATGGSAGGMVITNSNVTAGNGAITINGDAGWPSGVVTQVSRGVRLDSLAKVNGAGNISITGRVGSSSLAASKGVDLGTGSEVSSSGGNVTVNGTFNNPAAFDGQGVRIAGKVAAPVGTVAITGNATVGGASGTGVLIDPGANISAALGVTITGSVSSSTTATNIVATSMQGGTVASAGNIVMTGTVAAPSAVNAKGLTMDGGTVSTTGAATISLTGSGVPAPAPASSYALNIAGTTVSSAGGQINLAGDRINIISNVNAGAGRVVITPTATNRQITLGGTDETFALNLSNSELNQITAGTLVIGGSSYTGGIAIGNTGGTINPLNVSALSLVNSSASGPGITQAAGITVANLNADARNVLLSSVNNQISQISGRAYSGNNFQIRSASALSVGAVDGVNGISNSGGAVVLTSAGALSQTQAIVADTFLATGTGGITLAHSGNQIQNFGSLYSGALAGITLRNTAANATFNGSINSVGRVDIANTGSITLGTNTLFNSSSATGTTAATAAMSIVATGGISTSGSAVHLMNSGSGSVYLEAGNGSIGADAASPVELSTSGLITAVAGGSGSQVNLKLTGSNTLENISATGAVNVGVSGAGDLSVKTVSGSDVTLSAAAGAILDANGTANNITATTLNATAANGITLGTNVTGLQTLGTTAAVGDISIAAANAINTGNFSIATNAGSAQTVSLASAAGITVGSAFGNAQDNFKLIATGGNLNVNAALQANQLTLSTTGTSAQTAAITANGLELLGTGSHTLNSAGNAVMTLGGNTGNVDYAQAGALAIGTVNTAGLTTTGKVLVRTTGAASDITLNNGITSGSAANDSLVLAAGRNFVNNAGATPLNPGAGRFLVYATNPAANTFGAMVSTGNAFGRIYAANAPSDASMTSLTGNRFVYSYVPTLNVSGDNQTKAYGGADPVLTYTVGSGLVAGDTAATALGGALSAPTGAATTNPTYAITQGTLASALGYNVAYTNGTLTVTGTPAPPAPAPAPVPAPAQSTASSSGVPAALNDAYVTALNNIAGTDEPLGGSSSSKSPVFDGASLIKALNDAAAEAEKESGGE